MASSDLKIRQVEAFRALMQRHTVTRAAQTLHVSQPAVSRLLADFEASVGFTLFERQQGRLVPTAEAHVLHEEVERAFVGMDRIAQAAQQQPQPEMHLRADRNVRYERVAQVMASIQRGGLSRIGFVTEPQH